MKTIARQIAIDMYKCKSARFDDLDELEERLQDLIGALKLESVDATIQELENKHLVVTVVFEEGSLVIHAFGELAYVSVDMFICQENASPEKFFGDIRKLFKPEKTKTTQLKRGDFGTVKDLKPKTKTHIAPIRRIANTGTKVIHLITKKG